MRRLLHLDTQPYFYAKSLADQATLNIITPTRAAARALEVGPNSLRDIATQILTPKRIRITSPLNGQKALQAAIREVLPVRDLEGTARTWMPTIQTILRSMPSLPADVEVFSEKVKQLFRVTHTYQTILRQDSLIDRAEVLWQAVGEQPERRSLLLYGYFHPRPDELAFIEAIAGEDSVFCLPVTEHSLFNENRAIANQLQNCGWQVTEEQEREISKETTSPGSWLAQQFISSEPQLLPNNFAIAAHIYDNQEAEARGVLAQIKQLLHEGVAARDIGIIARDERACGSQLLDIAWEYGIPLRALYSIPLSATRVGAWLSLLLEVIGQGFPFEATARLFSHPLSISAGGDFWTTVRQQRPSRFDQWQTVVQQVAGLDLSPLKMPHSARRDTWVEKIRTVLQTFNLRRRAARWARESVAYNNLESGLVDLARPEEQILNWKEFADELRASLALLGTPAQPGRGGVELHTPGSIRGARYRYLFVIDAVEGKLPAPVQDDRVLDFYERKQLQRQGLSLQGAVEAAQQEAFDFYGLLHTVTERFTLSYATLGGEPSSYFKRLGLRPEPVMERAIASPEEARRIYLRQPERWENDAVLEGAIASFTIEQHRESEAPHNEYDGIVGMPFDYSEYWFSTSQLTQLGQCAFKWFINHVLKVTEIEEVEEDVSPVSRGNLYHKVLELALTAFQADPTLDITSEQQLHSWFLEAEQQLKFPPLPAWESRRVEHIRVLRRAMQQPDFLQSGAEVLHLEDRFEGEWEGFKVRGYVDRIDRTEQGLILIDYKTRSSPPAGVKDETGKAKIDLQLPLYKAVAAPFFYPDESVQQTSYYSLTAGRDISAKPPTAEQLKAVANRLKTHLSTGHYPVQPDIERKACAYCVYDSVCRQGERLNRKDLAQKET